MLVYPFSQTVVYPHTIIFVPFSARFTSVPNSGTTGPTLTVQEERLCLTITRLSYQLTGKRHSPKSASGWDVGISQDSSSSPRKPVPFTHWSPMVIIAPRHWAVSRGSHWLALKAPCSPTATRKGSMLRVPILQDQPEEQELVSLATNKTIVLPATPESDLVLGEPMTIPTHVETRLHREEIMETDTSRPWGSS